MSKKYFVFSDVHSYYDLLIKALEEQQFDINNQDHIIISCGDLCDRGDKPKECLEFVLDLYDKGRAILIKGNHEDLMEEAICRHYFKSHDFHNKTNETAEILTGLNIYDCGYNAVIIAMKANELWNKYINATIDYYEFNNYIFVHGWIPTGFKSIKDEQYSDLPEVYWPTEPCYLKDWRNTVWADDWKEARWANGMKMWNLGIKEPEKTIVCGHYHTSWGHSRIHNDGKEWLNSIETYYIDPETGKQEPHVNHGIFYDDGIIAIDACTAISHQVNVLVIEEN